MTVASPQVADVQCECQQAHYVLNLESDQPRRAMNVQREQWCAGCRLSQGGTVHGSADRRACVPLGHQCTTHIYKYVVRELRQQRAQPIAALQRTTVVSG